MPAIAIAMYIIGRVGKKWLFCATLFRKFTISAGNTIMPVYTAELYPTAIRNAGVGACNVAAGLALILTPYLEMLNKIEKHLLMTLLTAWTIFGGIVVIFLPESRKHPQTTVSDVEEERN
uniref:Major facilitator superfamily (MFS) profile domain-containing protein n=1 Tax=Phlebotomus papatasi TaxID=29031 RepID=A0A1B0CZU7_PHLPP